MSIAIVKQDITRMDVDAVVNAANAGLRAGGGVCGAIFREAGHADLQAACDAIGHCDTGSAVITPGFNLKARYIIHAVGPVWEGGTHNEANLLVSCYAQAIDLAVEHGCRSIAFPLISAGIYGYPKDEAWEVALTACANKLAQLEGTGRLDDGGVPVADKVLVADGIPEAPAQPDALEIYFCVISDDALHLGNRILLSLDEQGSG